MKTYENNMADQALVVKSLKVLQKIDGGGITEIKQGVEALKQQTNIQLKQQEEYWKTLSNDSVISPIEKQTLKREMENVRQSYAAIIQQATSLGYTSSILQDYIRTYEALRDYIYITLKLFDDMTSETKLNDRDYFNSLFSNYFFLESFVLLAITKGILDTVNIRVLNSLLEEGTEGETALYHGGLYQYTDGKWKSISTGNYKGAKDELPAAEEDSFFLASETFISTEVLMVNGEELYINGDQLGINMLFQKGYIYYVFNGQWKVEADKTNWRYVAAFADVLNVTGELPQIFQDAINDLQDQIDQQQTEIDSKVSHVPVYLGASSAIPSNPGEGDFFTFTGSTYGTWYNSMVYKYENNAWQYLDPDDTGNRNYYMQALTDILACNNASNGFFATIFASSFFSNAASIENLSTKTIYLKSGGNIQSEETAYIANQQGLKIDADGNIDANGDTHLGASSNNKVAIGVTLKNSQGQYTEDFNNYDTVIGGRTLLKSETTIKGVLDGASGNFSGFLNCNPLFVYYGELREYIFYYNPDYDGAEFFQTLVNLGFNGDDLNIEDVLSNYYLPRIDIILEETDSSGGIIQTLIEVKTIRLSTSSRPVYHHDIYFNTDEYTITVIPESSTKLGVYARFSHSLGGTGICELRDLPDHQPQQSDTVWRDSNGYLRIS